VRWFFIILSLSLLANQKEILDEHYMYFFNIAHGTLILCLKRYCDEKFKG
jgi:hypothetical protein